MQRHTDGMYGPGPRGQKASDTTYIDQPSLACLLQRDVRSAAQILELGHFH